MTCASSNSNLMQIICYTFVLFDSSVNYDKMHNARWCVLLSHWWTGGIILLTLWWKDMKICTIKYFYPKLICFVVWFPNDFHIGQEMKPNSCTRFCLWQQTNIIQISVQFSCLHYLRQQKSMPTHNKVPHSLPPPSSQIIMWNLVAIIVMLELYAVGYKWHSTLITFQNWQSGQGFGSLVSKWYHFEFCEDTPKHFKPNHRAGQSGGGCGQEPDRYVYSS